jgi:hypothetical protein
MPPSTLITTPDTNLERSLARNRTAPAALNAANHTTSTLLSYKDRPTKSSETGRLTPARFAYQNACKSMAAQPLSFPAERKSRKGTCPEPQLAREAQRLDSDLRPPVRFLAGAVQFAMMRPAERDRKFIADLLSEPARLRKAKMVRVAGLTAANEAGLLRHKA